MTDITTIPQSELEKDLADSLSDIRMCEFALLQGITSYSGGKVEDRSEKNYLARGFVTIATYGIR